MRGPATLLAVVGFAVAIAAAPPPAAAQEPPAAAPPALGAEFPAFTLPGTDGKPISLADFKGKAILLSFWSCYTDTCFTSVRVFEELLKEHGPRGLVAPTVCSEVPPALEKDGYAGLLRRCGTGQVVMIDRDMALTKRLGVTEFPTTYLIDRNHAVWQVVTGIRPLLEEEFRGLVKSLVAE